MNPNELNTKLTAYALGELSPTETADIETAIKNNPALQPELEAIQATIDHLEYHFEQDESPALSDTQREAIQRAAQPARKTIPLALKWGLPLSAAAALMIAVTLPTLERTKEVAAFSATSAPEESAFKLDTSTGIEVAALEPAPQLTIVEQGFRSPESADVRTDALRTGRTQLADAGAKDAAVHALGNSAQFEMDADSEDRPAVDDQPLVMKGLYAARSADIQSVGRPLAKKSLGTPPPFANKASAKIAMTHLEVSHPSNDGEQTKSVLPASTHGPSLEHYKATRENNFKRVADHPLSTFSIDVDTASYSNMRRFLSQGNRPPADAIRIEELINYFTYNYAPPTNKAPFAAHIESATCPWQPEHRLVRIGLKGKVLAPAERPALNLVFLIDVSESMRDANKLPLVKNALKALLQQLDERDRIAIVVYAGASGLVLESTSAADQQRILDALDRLRAGGSTNGGAGIDLAYQTALTNFHNEGVNRVILCTDGDFNVGRIQTGDLIRDVETKANDGVFLSVLGFGMGNYKDSTLEQLADKGNGNYAYIDTYSEARKVLVEQMTGTLITIAKDVKIQVEFNPERVAGYRLIGYVNRMLKKEDFNDDKQDAGEIGAGHTVTALYEVVPAGQPVNRTPDVDSLKYQSDKIPGQATATEEMLTMKLRFKQPDAATSTNVEYPFIDDDQRFGEASEDFRFAASVAGLGMLLRDSQHHGGLTYDNIIDWSSNAQGKDPYGYRREFTTLVRDAKSLAPASGKNATPQE